MRRMTPMKADEIKNMAEEQDMTLMFMDGYDDCVIGLATTFGNDGSVAYSVDKIINKLIEQDNMSSDEAYEFFDFNMAGAYVGEKTPVFVY